MVRRKWIWGWVRVAMSEWTMVGQRMRQRQKSFLDFCAWMSHYGSLFVKWNWKVTYPNPSLTDEGGLDLVTTPSANRLARPCFSPKKKECVSQAALDLRLWYPISHCEKSSPSAHSIASCIHTHHSLYAVFLLPTWMQKCSYSPNLPSQEQNKYYNKWLIRAPHVKLQKRAQFNPPFFVRVVAASVCVQHVVRLSRGHTF